MIKGKSFVITGCLQGIGRETVRVFAEHGADVFACAYKKSEEFEEFCDSLSSKNGVIILPIYFDLMDNDAIKNGVKQILQTKKDIHGLVNIAGINKDAIFSMVSQRDMEDVFQVNVFSQIVLSQFIVRMMQRKRIPGSIVFTSSVTAFDGNEGQLVYGASKAALIGVMRTMALELGPQGIRVNAVAPGVIDTPMTRKLDENILNDKIRKMDIPRLGLAEEVTNLYLFLMSDLSSHISGQTIRVDGGIL